MGFSGGDDFRIRIRNREDLSGIVLFLLLAAQSSSVFHLAEFLSVKHWINMGNILKEVTIKNKQGLHARPAALFVQVANKFDAVITVKKGRQKVNGKSIMGI